MYTMKPQSKVIEHPNSYSTIHYGKVSSDPSSYMGIIAPEPYPKYNPKEVDDIFRKCSTIDAAKLPPHFAPPEKYVTTRRLPTDVHGRTATHQRGQVTAGGLTKLINNLIHPTDRHRVARMILALNRKLYGPLYKKDD
jgi:hypothetical protein